MALTDTQIDRFSRQIILPQIGARGQERLLASSVALAGGGALVQIVALSLAGAGVGRITLHGAGRARLRAEILDLNPDVGMALASGGLGSVGAEVLVACDVPLAELEGAAASGSPVVAGGVDENGGWLVVGGPPDICVVCAARAAGSRRDTRCDAPPTPAAGVVASLMSLAVLKLGLGLGEPARRIWLQFDARQTTLTEQPLSRAADCPVCVS